jgi:hypothetical protein
MMADVLGFFISSHCWAKAAHYNFGKKKLKKKGKSQKWVLFKLIRKNKKKAFNESTCLTCGSLSETSCWTRSTTAATLTSSFNLSVPLNRYRRTNKERKRGVLFCYFANFFETTPRVLKKKNYLRAK